MVSDSCPGTYSMADGTLSQTQLREATLREVGEVVNSKLQRITEIVAKMEEKIDRKFTEMIEMIRSFAESKNDGRSLLTSSAANLFPETSSPKQSRAAPSPAAVEPSIAETSLLELQSVEAAVTDASLFELQREVEPCYFALGGIGTPSIETTIQLFKAETDVFCDVVNKIVKEMKFDMGEYGKESNSVKGRKDLIREVPKGKMNVDVVVMADGVVVKQEPPRAVDLGIVVEYGAHEISKGTRNKKGKVAECGVSLDSLFIGLVECISTVCENVCDNKLPEFSVCFLRPPRKPPDALEP